LVTVHVPWSTPHSRFTLLFERFAIDLLTATQVQAKTAALLRLTPRQVHEVMARADARGLARRDTDEGVPHHTLDEKSFQHGYQYLTVLGDADEGCVLEACETSTVEATQVLLTDTLTDTQRRGVASITMDMWEGFMRAATTVLPEADNLNTHRPACLYATFPPAEALRIAPHCGQTRLALYAKACELAQPGRNRDRHPRTAVLGPSYPDPSAIAPTDCSLGMLTQCSPRYH